ncbi:hypothetical protein Dimus_002092 [Dionaea muscipula]
MQSSTSIDHNHIRGRGTPMAEELPSGHPPDAGDLYYQTAGDMPPIPLDHDLLMDDLPFPQNFDGDFGFDLDLEFSFDDLNFAEGLLVDPDSSSKPESPVSDDVFNVAPCPISGSDSGSTSPEHNQKVDDRVIDVDYVDDVEVGENCDALRVPDYSSPAMPKEGGVRGPAGAGDSDYLSSESENCEQVYSHGSGGCNSAVGQGVNSPSRSGNSERDVSSSFSFENQNLDNDMIEDKKVKVQDAGRKFSSKRKKELEEENVESRTIKFRKSSLASENADFSVGSEDDEKRKARLMRNRESAQLSRQRKKQYVEELEDKVRAMHSTITDLNSKISFIMAENASLRQKLSGSGVFPPPPPPPGMYPMAPMAYPWMPCPPYVVKTQGSQVPLVPIPRLKPQQPAPAPKVNKKLEGKKSEGKTKKVASISFLGLLFFIMLFGGLVPMVNDKFGGIGDTGFISGRFDDSHKGKVLTFNGHPNGTDRGESVGVSGGKFDHGNGHCVGMHCRRLASDRERKEHDMHFKSGSGGFSSVDNTSEPLVASLYVPRNDKLVKIDGNLIIHSIMATEKSRSSPAEGKTIGDETSLALAENYGPPYPIPGIGRTNIRHSQMDRDVNGRHRALGSVSTDDFRSFPSDGKLQQWFREGLAGPMLSSGMCTEVFQFDVSPTPGAIVPAAPVANITASDTRRNSTQLKKTMNRRILHGNSIPVSGHTLNVTKEHVAPNSQPDKLPGNKSRSSVIVNVLVDPREAGDGDDEGIMGAKALSRIFVVVLIDSVKYVTYSCVLPRVGSSPQLVTA